MEKTEIEKNYEALENTLKALFPKKELLGKIKLTIQALKKRNATNDELLYIIEEFPCLHTEQDFMPADLIILADVVRGQKETKSIIDLW